MNPVEYTTFWVTVFAYSAGTVLALGGLVFRKDRWMGAAVMTCAAGLASHLAAITARVAHTGHIPVASRYENILTGSAVVMLFSLVSVARRRGLRPLLVFTAPLALLMLGYALLNQPRFTTMSLVLDNLWMFVHILFAWLAYGSYSLAAALSFLYLLKERSLARGTAGPEGGGLMARIPDLGLLEDLVFRFVIFGFVAHVVMLASGSIWARDLWGSYWNWDPVETWSLLSALIYGLWIHLRLTLRWHGRRMAWIALVSLATVLIAFWGTTLMGPTSHSLDDLRLRAPAGDAGDTME